MFGILPYAIIGIAVIVFITIAFGFFRMSRLQGKIFQHVENQLDRQINESEKSLPGECAFCGAQIKSGNSCPSCGAPRD